MKLEFQSKHPHRTRFLVVAYDKQKDDVNPIVNAMESVGWLPKDCFFGSKTPEIHFSKPGTDIFNSWTTEEHKLFIKEAEKALKTVGIKNVPYRKLTIQDLI